MALLRRNGTSAWIGLPEREATKLQDLWDRNELGVELSVEVRAPVVVGVYPMRIARYVMDGNGYGTGAPGGNGQVNGGVRLNGNGEERPHLPEPREALGRTEYVPRPHQHAPRPMPGAPTYGSQSGMRSPQDTHGG